MALTDEKIKQAAKVAHDAFQIEGWTYYDGPPTRERIETTIRSLLNNLEKFEIETPQEHGENRFVETGRIRVQRDYYEGNGGADTTVYLSLANDIG